MREIKFRAFLNSKYYEKPCMLSWEELLGQYDAIDMFQRDLMTLVQYTGLLDKNGREIYECDIVQSIPRSKHEKSFVGAVYYGRVDPSFTIHDNDGHDFRLYSSGEYRTYEVIGNIFENLELLEVAKHDED
jgi:uncharacterized phage protein (TIGR01671 family)